MAHLLVLDGSGSSKIMMATGEGTNENPLVVEHKDSAAIDKLKEALEVLGKVSDVNDLYPYQLNGIESNPPIPLNIIQLLRCLNISLLAATDETNAAKNAVVRQASEIGSSSSPIATYEKVIELNQFGNPANYLPLMSLAKGILVELHLLRTGVTT